MNQSDEKQSLIKKSENSMFYIKILFFLALAIVIAFAIFLWFMKNFTDIKPTTHPNPTTYIPHGNSSRDIHHAVNIIREKYCPYNDFRGLSNQCTKKNNPIKTNMSPLHVLIGVGWDPIQGQIKLPFLQMSYTKNKYYVSNSNTKYYIPDEVILEKRNISYRNMITRIYKTVDQYLDNLNPNRTTINSGPLGIPINDIPNFLHFFDNGNSVIASTTEYRSNFDLKLNGIQTIIPVVQQAINSLPQQYDPDLYKLFIEYWGTSVVISGTSGGLGQQTVMMKQCFGGIDFSSESELYMLKQFYSKEYSHINFAARFTQYSKASIIDMFGGNPEITDPKEWITRVNSFDDNSILIKVSVKPITDYILNPIIKENMINAITEYYTNGIQQIDQFKKNYYNNIYGPKNFEYIAFLRGNYQYGSSGILSIKQSQLFSFVPAWLPIDPDWFLDNGNGDRYFTNYCGRDINGNIISNIDYAGLNTHYNDNDVKYSILQYPESVWYGCSVNHIQVLYYDNLITGEKKYFDIYNACCQNCIPTNNLNNICECPSF
jgi:hypothetical protein